MQLERISVKSPEQTRGKREPKAARRAEGRRAETRAERRAGKKRSEDCEEHSEEWAAEWREEQRKDSEVFEEENSSSEATFLGPTLLPQERLQLAS